MIVCMYPLWYVFVSSLSDGNYLVGHSGFLLFPIKATTIAYKRVFENPMIRRSYFNTVIIVIVGVTINLIMTSLCAYALSRKDFKLKKALNIYIIITMFIGGGLIPMYLIVKGIGLLNSLWALILPGCISTYNMIIMRTNFSSVPRSLEESARIDGANDFHILFKIYLPVCKAIIAVMILFYGVGHWNSWFSAMIYLRDRSLFPLQLILREILVDNSISNMLEGEFDSIGISESIKYATIIVATLPILFVYPFIQRYFVKGMMIGSLKG